MNQANLTQAVSIITTAGAQCALSAAEESAKKMGLAVSIAVVDNVGNLVAFLRTGNACVTSIEASIRKARTSANLSMPTKSLEDLLHGGYTSLLTFEFISPSQGGVPILVDGVVVGGIGCSGSSGDDDEVIARAGVEAVTQRVEQAAVV